MCGVPQGSILTFKLCILYINDVCDICIANILNFVMFADGTNLLCTGDKTEEVTATVSAELNKLHNWFPVKKLSLNIKKKKKSVLFSVRRIVNIISSIEYCLPGN